MNVRSKRLLVALFSGAAVGIAATQIHTRPRAAHAQDHPAPGPEPAASDAGKVLEDLLAGNARFVAGKASRPHADVARVQELAKGQHPRAVVLACADSRVTPEIVLDQGLGDLFTIRVAGNVLDPSVTGSVEYGIEHLGCSLVLVLGHAGCGGVTAALEAYGKPDALVGLGPNLERLVEQIEPVIPTLPADLEGPDRLEAAVEANARLVARELERQSDAIRHAVEAKRCEVVPAVYDLAHGGHVAVLDARGK